VIAAVVVVPLLVFGHGGSGGRSAFFGDRQLAGRRVDAQSGRLVADTGIGANTHGCRGRRRRVLGHQRRPPHGVADRPRTTAVVDTIPVGNGPSGIATGAGAVWVVNSLDGTVLPDRPGHEHGPSRRSPSGGSGRAGSSTRPARSGVANTGTTRNDHEDRPRGAAGGPKLSRSPRPSSPSAQARCGRASVRGPGGSHRSDDREAGRLYPRPGTARRHRLRPRRGVGWRTAGKGRVLGSIRDELRHRLLVPTRQRAICGGESTHAASG